jgi:predicted Zn-dependent protease with MMP-like domain
MVPPSPAPPPSFDRFCERAKEIFERIPTEFTEGIEDLAIHRGVKRHPQLDDIVTLGECEPSPLVAMTGGGEVRSIVHLYYGSFVEQAREDETFRFDEELVETVEHEVQHHVEDKAGRRGLLDEDDLFDAHARFLADLDVPPGWYRAGHRLEPNVYAVDLDLFVEVEMRRKAFEALRGKTLVLKVMGETVETEIPADADPEEVFSLEGQGLLQTAEDDDPDTDPNDLPAGDLHVVPLVR